MIQICLFNPEIPGNTGNLIRLCAITGAKLHLIEPLGFDMSSRKLKRAGLDYHEFATVSRYPNFDDFVNQHSDQRIIAFSSKSEKYFQEIEYKENDILLFGPESSGLPNEIKECDKINELVKIPMLSSRRSLNLAVSASIATYECLRQFEYKGLL